MNDDDFDIEVEKERLEGLHQTATDLFKEAENGWRDIRTRALEDLTFYQGHQYDDEVVRRAKLKGEPYITVNRLPQFVSVIANDMRQREMNITVNSTDAEGSEEIAEVFTGIIRAIENESHAKSHYVNAAGENGALVLGFGFIKIDVDYINRNSFDQKISISSVKDPMKIVCDPAALEPDFSDAEYWFEFDDYPEAVFKRMFPKAEAVSADMYPIGATKSDWITDNGIRVARFWYKEEEAIISYMMDDGSVVQEEVIQGYAHEDEDPISESELDKSLKDGKVILRQRQITRCRIKWCDFSGTEILDRGEWAGEYFPFIGVTGPSLIVDGVRDIRGMIRYAKDPQKMLNQFASSTIRRIQSANKSPWIVDAGSIRKYQKLWETANTENHPFLPYDSVDGANQNRPISPPQRADQTGQVQDLLMASEKFENDLKAVIGIYDAGLGISAQNEQSGVAIKTLAQQGHNANFHYSDNLTRSLQQVGRVLVNLIPKIYDTPRALRTMNVEGEQDIIFINQIFSKNGQLTQYNLTEGDYDVTVSVGPGHATAKQQALEGMLQMTGVNPEMMPYIQDLLAGQMDFPGAKNIQKRLAKVAAISFPQLFDKDMEDVPPQVAAQMAEQEKLVEELTNALEIQIQEVDQLKTIIANKAQEHEFNMIKLDREAELEIARNEQRASNDEEKERLRAYREAAISSAEIQLKEMDMRLKNNEKMIQLTMEAIKLVGPGASELIAQELPRIDSIVDESLVNNSVNPTFD